MEDFEVVALVPMKGHSERIPRKNVRSMGGKPLCYWVLETLSQVDEIGEIVVNTDSDEIAELVSARFDVRLHLRPEPLCGDMVSMNRIIENDLSQLAHAKHFLQTHVTNPLLSAQTVRRALRCYLDSLPKHDSLFSVTAFQERFYDRRGRPINHNPAVLERTQDLEPLLMENSNLYVFSRQSFAASDHRIGQHPVLFEMNPVEAIDIDEEPEWRMAEALLATA